MTGNQAQICNYMKDVLDIPENALNEIIAHLFSILDDLDTLTNKNVKNIFSNDQQPRGTLSNPTASDPLTNPGVNVRLIQ